MTIPRHFMRWLPPGPGTFDIIFPDEAQARCVVQAQNPVLVLPDGSWRPASYDDKIGRWVPDTFISLVERGAWLEAHAYCRANPVKRLVIRIQYLLKGSKS